jgi:endoglycosylceramidase
MTRWLPRAAVVLVLVALATASYPGADLAAWAIRPDDAPAQAAPAGPLPWLHVAHPAGGLPFIADPQGRQVILRGAVDAGLVDWWSGTDPNQADPAPYFPIDPAAYDNGCPQNSDLVPIPPVCVDDFAQMAGLGFNVVRLPISWSLLEPAPGRFSALYLDRIAQVVGWARRYGIYVMLDMHQDGYSRFLPRPASPPVPGGVLPALNEHDGAPAWAVDTFGLPSETFIGQREMNPAEDAAMTAFWLNWAGLQDQYLQAVATLARRFRDDSTVVGYDLYNEPWPGFVSPPLFDDLLLIPFYRRAIDALTGVQDGVPCPAGLPLPICGHPDLGVHTRQLMFVEPDLMRVVSDFDLNLPQRLTSYPNVVYSIHTYTHKFTVDAVEHWPASVYPPGGYATSYRSAEAAARSLGAALFVTEYGNEPALDSTMLTTQTAEQEHYLLGSTFWPLKENCNVGQTWGIYQGVFGGAADERCAYDSGQERAAAAPQNGCLRADDERLLARAWPREFAGRIESYHYDPTTGAFSLLGDARAGSPDTVVYVPPEVPGGVSVTGAGLRVVDQADGSRLLEVSPHGTYTVQIAAAPLRLTGCA